MSLGGHRAGALVRAATTLLSPHGARARLTVVTFHRVLPAPDPLEPDTPDAAEFDRQLLWLRGQFNVMPLDEACDRLFAGTLPARAAAISIDDGYLDNFEIALPILQRRGLVATFFIATHFVNGAAMFNDRINEAVRLTARPELDAGFLGLPRLPVAEPGDKLRALRQLVRAVKYQTLEAREASVQRIEALCATPTANRLMMQPHHLRALLDAGMGLGGHTRRHPILRLLPDDEAYAEIRGSFEDLQAITGRAPRLFAFPNGRLNDDFDARHAEMARRAGFRYAFTTDLGAAGRRSDPMQLPRFATWNSTRLRFELRLVHNLLKSQRPARP